jgi:signal transduction histidine kinase
VRAGEAACPACGVNLALAAVLAERHTLARSTGPLVRAPGLADLPRFGEFLVSQGYLSGEQLRAGLARQREAVLGGVRQTIGQTLLEMGHVTREQLELASIQQVKQLQNALEESNRRLEQRVVERTQALEQALQKLTELAEVKANFVANISHELRTPLVPIRGYADLLGRQALGPLTDRQRDAVEAIRRSALRLEELLNELIQFASSVKGRLVINPSVVALVELAEPLWDYFGPRAEAGGVTLRQDLAPGLPPVHADPEKLYWVLFQLMDNAVKFTPPGGEVTLRARPANGRVRLEVQDTGLGIAADQIGDIFRPFHQAPPPPGQMVDGTGLGLALVKRIVDAHHAQVEVDSAPGRGSTFAFELPAARPRR